MNIQQQIELNGCRFYYERQGSGAPVVLIHGMGWDSRAWDDQFDEFSSSYSVVRYDLRGFGRSGPPPEQSYSHIRDLEALLDELDISKAHLIGHSLGGYVAVDFSLTYPGRVDRLVLADPAVSGFEWSQELTEPAFVETPRLAVEEGIERARQSWLAFPPFARAMQNRGIAERITRMVEDYSGWHWLNQGLAEGIDPPALNRLADIAAPTLIVVGGSNHPDYLEVAGILDADVPNSTMVVIPDAAHALTLEQPTLFNRTVLDFLKQSE